MAFIMLFIIAGPIEIFIVCAYHKNYHVACENVSESETEAEAFRVSDSETTRTRHQLRQVSESETPYQGSGNGDFADHFG
ncbi:hypothetical protein RE428_48730 (plasmid) [Marinobacter nanhaiticus D15-8W]|nr:hypothetical protein RE428_48730 [Marinobacter nanhaiticus D15-8W]